MEREEWGRKGNDRERGDERGREEKGVNVEFNHLFLRNLTTAITDDCKFVFTSTGNSFK